MIRRRTTHAALVAVFAVLATGCSIPFISHPATAQLSIEGQAAVGGRQLVAAMLSSARGIDQLIDGGVIPPKEGVQLLRWLQFGVGEAGRLADVLLIIDSAKDDVARQNAMGNAAAIVRGIQAGLLQAVVPIGSEEGRQKAAAILQPIGAALSAISVILPAGKEPEPWMP